MRYISLLFLSCALSVGSIGCSSSDSPSGRNGNGETGRDVTPDAPMTNEDSDEMADSESGNGEPDSSAPDTDQQQGENDAGSDAVGDGSGQPESDPWSGWYEIQKHQATIDLYNAQNQSYTNKENWCSDLSRENVAEPKNFLRIEGKEVASQTEYFVEACTQKDTESSCQGFGVYWDVNTEEGALRLSSTQGSQSPDYDGNGNCLCQAKMNRIVRENGRIRVIDIDRGGVSEGGCDGCSDINYRDASCLQKQVVVASPIE